MPGNNAGNVVDRRLTTMSPLYPCGKPCSTGTRIETVKKLAQFSAISNGIMVEYHWSVFNSSIESITHIYTLTITVIHKSRSLGLWGQVFESLLTEAPSSKRAQGNERLIVISLYRCSEVTVRGNP